MSGTWKSLSLDQDFFWPNQDFFPDIHCDWPPAATWDSFEENGQIWDKISDICPLLFGSSQGWDFFSHFSNFILDIFQDIFKSWICLELFYHFESPIGSTSFLQSVLKIKIFCIAFFTYTFLDLHQCLKNFNSWKILQNFISK